MTSNGVGKKPKSDGFTISPVRMTGSIASAADTIEHMRLVALAPFAAGQFDDLSSLDVELPVKRAGQVEIWDHPCWRHRAHVRTSSAIFLVAFMSMRSSRTLGDMAGKAWTGARLLGMVRF
jgi:hypothetical protein